jgi:hypothetical protein
MKRSQKKLDKTLGDLKTKIKEREEKEMRSDSEAIEKLRWEKDRKKAKEQLYMIFQRSSPGAGLEAYDIFMKRYSDTLTDPERKALLFKKAMSMYYLVRLGKKDLSVLRASRAIALELLRDEEVSSDPHFELDVRRLLRHLALEERLVKGVG